jgi:son of sevenless-like protein
MEEYNDESKQLIRDVYTFARDTVKSTDTPGSGPLMAVLDQRLSGKDAGARKMIQTLNQSTPTPITPKNMKKLKFLDIDVTEFARQLTVIESRLYGKIKATECLNKTWQKKVADGEPDPAPNVKALILHSNQMTNWVAEMILAQADVKKRVVVIKHFVSVADVCIPHYETPNVVRLTFVIEMPRTKQFFYSNLHHFCAGNCSHCSTQAYLGSSASANARDS